MKVKSESEAAQSCPTLSDPMDWSLPGSSAHGIFQASLLEWVPSPSSVKHGSVCIQWQEMHFRYSKELGSKLKLSLPFLLEQGSQHDTGPWPVRKRTARQEGSGRCASQASSVLTATPQGSHSRLSSGRSVAASDAYQSLHSSVNCACEGSKWRAFYENHPETVPPRSVEKFRLPWNQSLMPKASAPLS